MIESQPRSLRIKRLVTIPLAFDDHRIIETIRVFGNAKRVTQSNGFVTVVQTAAAYANTHTPRI